MANYLVTTLDDGPAMREALGRAYAVAAEEQYPIPARFPDGTRDPNMANLTYWYADGRHSRDGTQYAFSADEFVVGLVGQTITTGFGPVVIPEPEELGAEWFPEAPPPPGT